MIIGIGYNGGIGVGQHAGQVVSGKVTGRVVSEVCLGVIPPNHTSFRNVRDIYARRGCMWVCHPADAEARRVEKKAQKHTMTQIRTVSPSPVPDVGSFDTIL